VGVGAIVLIEAEDTNGQVRVSRSASHHESAAFAARHPAFLEFFGRSLLERTVERLSPIAVDEISILVDKALTDSLPVLPASFANLRCESADDVWAHVTLTLKKYSDQGIQYAFIVGAGSYIEADLAAMLEFHRESNAAVTAARDSEGPLDLWIVDCDATCRTGRFALPDGSEDLSSPVGAYVVKDYTKRIAHPRDLRQLVTDTFLGLCSLRPSGREIRPNVWAEDDAQICRGARIVAPAYLGRQVTIAANALITRASNIERSSCIDCGTVIEDASVLPNTYVGMSLDVRHSVVCANRLFNLERDVVIESSDPNLFRSNVVAAEEPRAAGSKLTMVNVQNQPSSSQRPEHEAQGEKKLQPQECFTKAIPSVHTSTEFES
jgi:carbonic anhydrase/acetyltransferase-like protein (isoleucine patch superfamily)